MASSSGEGAGKQLGTSIVLLGGLIFGFAITSPLAMSFFVSFEGRITPILWVLALGFFASQCIYEAGRWMTIRLKGTRSALGPTMMRFVLFFSCVIFIDESRMNAVSFILVQLAVNAIATACFIVTLRKQFGDICFALPGRNSVFHLSNCGTSVASFLTNFATVAMVDRGLGGAGLAAFQALRSATNPVGLLSQVVDNHFSASLARSGRRFAGFGRAMRLALVGSIATMVLAVLVGPQLVSMLLGEGFSEYWVMFPLLLMASLAHALTRPIFMSWRLDGDVRALNTYSLVLTVVLLPILVSLGWAGWIGAMIAVFALLPATALVVNLLRCNLQSRQPTQ